MSEDEKISIEWLEKITEINKKDGVENSCAEILLKLIKKLQKENEELEEINNELEAEKNEAIRRYNFETIPIQKVKDKIEKEMKYHEKNILDIENMTMLKSKTAKEEAEIEFNKYAIVVLDKMLQELIEEREEKAE